MARIIFPHDNVGEARAYIKALTGLDQITIPNPPSNNDIGQVLKVESKFISVDASANIGFGFGSAQGNANARVLLQDYWFLKEIQENNISEINSWTFAVGFRVGIRIVGFKSKLDVGLGTLAAKAETEGLNIQLQIIRVGMPLGPNVPSSLAIPTELDVDKFGELRKWEGEIISYVEIKRNELSPSLVSASINIDADKLLNDTPGIRYSLWRISKGMTLKESLALLNAGKAPEVSPNSVRSVYSSIFRDNTMIIPGHNSENREPERFEKKAANDWLTQYKNM